MNKLRNCNRQRLEKGSRLYHPAANLDASRIERLGESLDLTPIHGVSKLQQRGSLISKDVGCRLDKGETGHHIDFPLLAA